MLSQEAPNNHRSAAPEEQHHSSASVRLQTPCTSSNVHLKAGWGAASLAYCTHQLAFLNQISSLQGSLQRSACPTQNHAPPYHRVAVADASGMQQQRGDGEGDMGRKYAKRSSGLQRTLQRFMPALFQPSLPMTTK